MGRRLAIAAENDNTGASSPHHHRDKSLGNMGAISVQSPFPFPRDTKSLFAFSNMHKKVNLSQRVRTACLPVGGPSVRVRPSVRLLVIPASCMIPFPLPHFCVKSRPCARPACLPPPWAHCGERLVKTYYASRLILLLQLFLSPSLPPSLSPPPSPLRHQRFAQHNNAEKSARSAY